jgi:hypothetical protein
MSFKVIGYDGIERDYIYSTTELKVDDEFEDIRDGATSTVESIDVVNDNLVYKCQCGQCTPEDRVIPLQFVRKIIPKPEINLN